MNERLKILKMLEEGKIKAEEAERLLAALNEGEGRKRGHHQWAFWDSMETIPDVIGAAVAGSFRHGADKDGEELRFGPKKRVAIEGISGDIEITGTDDDGIVVEKEGMARIIEAGSVLQIKAISGDLNIKTPRTIDIELKGVSGDLDLERITGQIDISSVSGDIKAREMAGSFRGNFVSGDVDLEYQAVERIEIKSKSGDIELRLGPRVEASLEVRVKIGDIDCDIDLKDQEGDDRHLKGTIRAPKGRIEIQNDYGDVSILKK